MNVLAHPGPRAFGRMSDGKLWEMVLGSGRAAEAVARYVPGLDHVAGAESKGLPGVGVSRAARVAAVVELGRRYAEYTVEPGEQIDSPQKVYRLLGPGLRLLRQEVFVALALDSRNRLLQTFDVAAGHLSGVEVHPREVFRPLVREAAHGTIVAHTHPSGDTAPSPEDIALTRRLHQVGELVGIPVLDHVIIGSRGYTSLAESGFL